MSNRNFGHEAAGYQKTLSILLLKLSPFVSYWLLKRVNGQEDGLPCMDSYK